MCISEKDTNVCSHTELFLIIMFICFALSLFSLIFQLFTYNFKIWQWIRGNWALALCWLWPAQVSENWLLKAFSQKQKVQKFTDKVYDSELQIFYQSASKKCFMCVPYNQKLQCLVSKPNQNIATSFVVIHIFQTFLKQEIQCRRMDSSETRHIGRLKNPLYKSISCR